jgi:hypothetical protein
MDFGYTDDQREIQRTARELLTERAKPERVREHAEAGTTDSGLWSELCELGWPGIAIAEEYGGLELGTLEQAILCEELGRSLAPVPFVPTVLAATLIAHAGSVEQQAAGCRASPPARPGRRERRARRRGGARDRRARTPRCSSSSTPKTAPRGWSARPGRRRAGRRDRSHAPRRPRAGDGRRRAGRRRGRRARPRAVAVAAEPSASATARSR